MCKKEEAGWGRGGAVCMCVYVCLSLQKLYFPANSESSWAERQAFGALSGVTEKRRGPVQARKGGCGRVFRGEGGWGSFQLNRCHQLCHIE